MAGVSTVCVASTIVLLGSLCAYVIPSTGYSPHHDGNTNSLNKIIRDSGKTLQQALQELRDRRRIHVSGERRSIFTELAKKSPNSLRLEKKGISRVSFKECNLDFGQRLDCGHYGIDEDGCYKRECCWGETTESDVPWCYHSAPTIKSACLLDKTERQECGFYGIRKEQCLSIDCCWQPSNDNGVPWCFQELRLPIFEGECGIPAQPPNVMSRIVGGTEAVAHSWPWMVSLQVGGDHFCGGTLINNQWIVSAAHCEPGFYWGDSGEIVLGMQSQSASESTKVKVEVEKLIAHEEYGQGTGMSNDIMLVKLKHPVNFTDAITPVCMPEQDFVINPGKRSYTTGWGHLKSGGSAPDTLQQVMIPIMNSSICNEGDWYDGALDESMICAGYEEGGRDSCQGDSGGPLVGYVEGKWTLIGIVSWGYGCAGERKPGIYSKTSMFVDWVQGQINANQER